MYTVFFPGSNKFVKKCAPHLKSVSMNFLYSTTEFNTSFRAQNDKILNLSHFPPLLGSHPDPGPHDFAPCLVRRRSRWASPGHHGGKDAVIMTPSPRRPNDKRTRPMVENEVENVAENEATENGEENNTEMPKSPPRQNREASISNSYITI